MYRRLATDAALGVLVAALCARVAWTAEAAPTLGDEIISAAAWDDAPRPLPTISDAAVQPAQMLMLPGVGEPYRVPTSSSGGTTWGYRSSAAGELANIPNMIGDSGLGGQSLSFTGLLEIELTHPTAGASRLSVADANSPIPVDRLYYSYRHLENASGINFFGLSDSVNLDRHLIGWESTFWGGSSSIELRLPLEERLRSRFGSSFNPGGSGVDPLIAPQETELGNIAAIFKFLLWEDEGVAVSAGLGVEIPTAKDVDYGLAIDGVLPFPNNPGLAGDTEAGFLTIIDNETVYLDPFLAWVVKPGERWFHQGFLQVNVAANPTRVWFQGIGDTVFLQNGVPIGQVIYFPHTVDLVQFSQQTLLQVNLGGGRYLVNEPGANGLRQLAVVGELHYTTALNDGHRADLPLDSLTGGVVPLSTIEFGASRKGLDLLNAVAGVTADISGWSVINGVVVPLRDSPDRGFDFQYNVQVQKSY